MKILVLIPSFRNGGTTTSLKNFVSQLDLSIYQIEVYAITNIGPNREFIAKYVKVLGFSLDDKRIKSIFKLTLKNFIVKIVKFIKKRLIEVGIDISPIIFKCVVRKLEKNNYNLVIAFQEGQTTRFVSYFKNVRKVSWVRCDYSNMLSISKIKPQHKLYSKIDQIVCVSEYTRDVFINLLPETHNKTIALHNLISIDMIRTKSNETKVLDSKFSYSGFKIISLGRIDSVKRFSLIPEIVSKLKERRLLFRWYILGEGEEIEKRLLINNIKKYDVVKELILLGEKNNPYPYIKESNLLVSTSLSEACPNVINESKILGTPIVVTDFGSVYEFIDDNVNGLISPIETIADKIEIMITDKELYSLIKTNVSNFRYNNDKIKDIWYNKILIT